MCHCNIIICRMTRDIICDLKGVGELAGPKIEGGGPNNEGRGCGCGGSGAVRVAELLDDHHMLNSD